MANELTQIRSGCGSNRSNCTNAPSDHHTCPFSEDVNDDHETLCTCCEDCAYECAMDV
jgi:hypothetical protein